MASLKQYLKTISSNESFVIGKKPHSTTKMVSLNDEKQLMIAAQTGNLDMVKQLVSKETKGYYNYETLKSAAANGHLEIIKYLEEIGTDIHDGNDIALRLAASEGHLEIVKYLISKGADIHASNDAALFFAKLDKQMDMVKYLVSLYDPKYIIDKLPQFSQYISDPNYSHAAFAGKFGMLDGFKEFVETYDPEPSTPNGLLMQAAWSGGGGEKYIQSLIDDGADVNFQSGPEDAYHTPLSWASYKGRKSILYFLISKGATKIDFDKFDEEEINDMVNNLPQEFVFKHYPEQVKHITKPDPKLVKQYSQIGFANRFGLLDN